MDATQRDYYYTNKEFMNHHVPDLSLADAIGQLVSACKERRQCTHLEMTK